MDITIEAIIGIIVVIILFKMTFFTIKKVVVNLITGYIAFYIATAILGMPIELDLLLWAFMAMFGPVAIIAVALWHYFGF